jgi:hypothetical protein
VAYTICRENRNVGISFSENVLGEPKPLLRVTNPSFSWFSNPEGFLTEFIPAPAGVRNDNAGYIFRGMPVAATTQSYWAAGFGAGGTSDEVWMVSSLEKFFSK